MNNISFIGQTSTQDNSNAVPVKVPCGDGNSSQDPHLHNSLDGIQGGTVNERYHLTKAQYDNLTFTFDNLVDVPSDQAITGVKTFTHSPQVPNGQSASDAVNYSQITDFVHLDGTEIITGAKTFSISPLVPAGLTDTAAVNFSQLRGALADTVLTGLALTISGSTVIVSPGSWRLSGLTYQTTTNTTLNIDAQDATKLRYDSIYADAFNTLHIVSGVASLTPVTPSIPNGTIKVGDIFITPTSVTAIQSPITNYVNTTSDQSVMGSKDWQGTATFDNYATFNQPIFVGSTLFLPNMTAADVFSNNPSSDLVWISNGTTSFVTRTASYRKQIISNFGLGGGIDVNVGDYNLFGTLQLFDAANTTDCSVFMTVADNSNNYHYEFILGYGLTTAWQEIKPIYTDIQTPYLALEVSVTNGVYSFRLRRRVQQLNNSTPMTSGLEIWLEITPTYQWTNTNGNLGTRGNVAGSVSVYKGSYGPTVYNDNLYDSTGTAYLKGGASSGFLPLTGGNMTGTLNISASNPINITGSGGAYISVSNADINTHATNTNFSNNGGVITLLHLGDGTQSALSYMPHLQVTSAPTLPNDVVRLSDLGSGGVVNTVSVTTANGISGTSSGGANPALTLSLGNITPTLTTTTLNGLNTITQDAILLQNLTAPTVGAGAIQYSPSVHYHSSALIAGLVQQTWDVRTFARPSNASTTQIAGSYVIQGNINGQGWNDIFAITSAGSCSITTLATEKYTVAGTVDAVSGQGQVGYYTVQVGATNNGDTLIGLDLNNTFSTGSPIVSVDNLIGGSGYTDGVYTGVSLYNNTNPYGRSSSATAKATITVSGGIVTDVTITYGGSHYAINDVLTVPSQLIGFAGSGFTCQVASIGAYTSATNYALRTRNAASLFAPPTTSYSSIILPPGASYTGNVDGSIWYDGTHLYAYVAGAARQLDQQTASGGTITNVTGTTNRINVTGSGSVTIDIASTYAGQASITTLGTITTGVWNGTTVDDAYITSATNWNLAYSSRIQSLTTTGSSGAATWSGGVLNIPNYTLAGLGGISRSSLSASAPLSYNNSTGVFTLNYDNGLTLNGSNLELGGALTSATTIVPSAVGNYFRVNYNGTTTQNVDLLVNPYGIIHLIAGLQSSSNNYSMLEMTTTYGQMFFWDSVNGNTGIKTDNVSGLVFRDDIFQKGAVYSADYSANYVSRSLIDKGYADSHYVASGGTIGVWTVGETPSGLLNGTNTIFALAYTPISGVMVFLNGVYMDLNNDYTISGATITFVTAPISTDKIRVTYMH